RMGIGQQARTRLSEAQRTLDEARRLQITDAAAAAATANRAASFAEEALRLASTDFDRYDRPYTRSSGGGMGGAILGGVLGSILTGGGGGIDGRRWGTRSPGRSRSS